ncbi:MAG: hypothetical protein IJ946_05660 [Clostridia bacterium]|nr:hypothetical protein [Clostridia bacterium]
MGYVDIHSHILPCIDDGAQSVEESIALLEQEKANGVTSVICTPHFYPEVDELEAHLEKCAAAFKTLKAEIQHKELPNLYLGHEVQYFTGISKCQTLDKLCISGTNVLLLELPFLTPITSSIINEVKSIYHDLGINVILAHVERYAKDRHYKDIIKLIKAGDASAQINADSIISPITQKVTLKLIKGGLVSYIASDAHSLSQRPVLLNKAFILLKDKYYPQLTRCKKLSSKLEDMLEGV